MTAWAHYIANVKLHFFFTNFTIFLPYLLILACIQFGFVAVADTYKMSTWPLFWHKIQDVKKNISFHTVTTSFPNVPCFIRHKRPKFFSQFIFILGTSMFFNNIIESVASIAGFLERFIQHRVAPAICPCNRDLVTVKPPSNKRPFLNSRANLHW